VSVAEAFGGEGDDGSRAPFREEVEDDDDDSEEESDGGEGDEEEEPKKRSLPPPVTSENAELAALDAEYAAADAAALGSREALREAAARDAKKGAAVAAQRQAWDRALEARIMLQRALGGCNRLPRPETMALVARSEGGGGGAGEEEPGAAEEGGRKKSAAAVSELGVAAAVSELGVAAAGVSREAAAQAVRLAEAADVLAARATGREAGRGGRKRKQEEGSDDEEDESEDEEDDDDGDGDEGGPVASLNPETAALWRRLERSIRSFEPVRDAAFDRWHRKAALLAGGGAALRGGLRVLDQPPSKQVAAAMAGSFGGGSTGTLPIGRGGAGSGAENRLLSRSRLMRADAPKRLGEPSVSASAAAASGEKKKENQRTSSPSDSGSDSSSSDDEEEDQPYAFFASDARDRDTYDDGEFYSQLLKEFVEANATGGGAGAGGSLGAPSGGRSNGAHGAANKRRKVVDRRASKGRKLRFDVMEKLVGFMAPVEEGEESALARQLAGCLFGVVRSKKGGKRAS